MTNSLYSIQRKGLGQISILTWKKWSNSADLTLIKCKYLCKYISINVLTANNVLNLTGFLPVLSNFEIKFLLVSLNTFILQKEFYIFNLRFFSFYF